MPRYTKSVSIIEAVGQISHTCDSREIREGMWLHNCLHLQYMFLSMDESPLKPGVSGLKYRLMNERCVVASVVTMADFRGQGHATQLYLECIKMFGAVYSDGLVSRSAEKIWKKLDSEGLAKVTFGKSGDEESPNVGS